MGLRSVAGSDGVGRVWILQSSGALSLVLHDRCALTICCWYDGGGCGTVALAGPVMVEDFCGCGCAEDALLVAVAISGMVAVADLGIGGDSILEGRGAADDGRLWGGFL